MRISRVVRNTDSLQIDAPESVEGLDSAYVVYRMKATIERPTFSHDIHARKVSDGAGAPFQLAIG